MPCTVAFGSVAPSACVDRVRVRPARRASARTGRRCATRPATRRRNRRRPARVNDSAGSRPRAARAVGQGDVVARGHVRCRPGVEDHSVSAAAPSGREDAAQAPGDLVRSRTAVPARHRRRCVPVVRRHLAPPVRRQVPPDRLSPGRRAGRGRRARPSGNGRPRSARTPAPNVCAVAVALPVEVRRLRAAVADLGHVRVDIEQAAVDHHVARVDGGCGCSPAGWSSSTTRSACLPTSSEPSCCRQAEVVGAVDGRRAQRLEVAEAALGQHPDFPVRRQALQLAVAADLDLDARRRAASWRPWPLRRGSSPSPARSRGGCCARRASRAGRSG